MMKAELKERINKMRLGEVPKGYEFKQGAILPVDWKARPMGQLMTKVNEKAGNKEYDILSITAGKGFVLQSDKFGKEIAGKQYEHYTVIKKGDFSYNKGNSKTYPQGCVYMLEDREEAVVPNVFNSFRPKSAVAVSHYYRHLFINGYLNHQLYRLINSGVRNDGLLNLYDDDFYSCVLPVPPIPEQEKIAEILTHCDKVIELKKKIVQEKRRQKKWLMQNLFDPDSGVRLPGFKKKWTKCSLASLGTFSKGTGISNEDCANGDIPCIKYGDIYMSYDSWFEKSVSYTDTVAATSSPRVSSGALLFTGSGEDRMEIGKCTAYLGAIPLAVGGDIIIMQPDCKKANPLFLAYQQSTEPLIKQKALVAQGYSIVHLYGQHIKGLQVCIPSIIEEQTAIANVLSTADREIDFLEQELVQWQAKKKALMQLLLTGIVRVDI